MSDTPEMKVAPEVMSAINQLRQRSEMLVSEIGRLEIHKSSLMGDITSLNSKATALLKQEGERLGIPAGAEWRVTPEGDVLVGSVEQGGPTPPPAE